MKTENFTLSIPFANTAARKNVKKLGGQWNADRKVWTVETTEKKIDLRNLSKFVVDGENKEVAPATAPTPATVDSGCGFRMQDTPRNWALVNKYGFDAIEMAD